MIVVVDASAAYATLALATYDAVLEHADEVLAPDLLIAELLNVRWRNQRARLAVPSLAHVMTFLTTQDRIVAAIDYAEDAARLAEILSHTVYDSLYAADAKRNTAKLLTADKRFDQPLRRHRLGSVLI